MLGSPIGIIGMFAANESAADLEKEQRESAKAQAKADAVKARQRERERKDRDKNAAASVGTKVQSATVTDPSTSTSSGKSAALQAADVVNGAALAVANDPTPVLAGLGIVLAAAATVAIATR